MENALTLAAEGLPELPEVPPGLLPESADSRPTADSAVARSDGDDADDNEAEPPPERDTEEELRAALDLIGPLVSQIKEAHSIATRWLEAAPQIDQRHAELSALEDVARDNFQAQLDKEMADAVSEARRRLEAELASTRSDLEEELERQRTLNDDLSAQLARAVEREAAAARATTEAQAAKELSTYEAKARSDLERRKDQAEIRSLRAQVEDAEASAQAFLARIRELEAQQERHALLQLHLGNRDPLELLDQLHALQLELTQSPAQQALSEVEREELRQLRKDAKNLRKDAEQARMTANEAVAQREAKEQELARLSFRAAATDTYKQMITQQRAELDDLRGRIGELRETYGSPFPGCEALAEQFGVERSRMPRRRARNAGIGSIAAALQNHLARDTRKPLRYRLEDLQIEFAGLSASNLHLFQGPSGTGKTSLPVALADALDWGCSIVAVQDGWNDRQDLLGYFNTFDQQFQETDFLKALYKAGTPEFRDRPYLIVLDEANLSYLERYFTDFLSRLEVDVTMRDPLSLAPPGLTGTPPRLEDGTLDVPENVWFVGTANQDATTKEFAPKSIDRAHLLELVRSRETPLSSSAESLPVDLDIARLQEWFSAAADEHAGVGELALGRLEDALVVALEKLELAPGNRLQRYADAFFPTLRAVGGTDGLGLDHLLTTKILYPLRSRAQTSDEPLRQLAEALSTLWQQVGYDESRSSASRLVARARNRG